MAPVETLQALECRSNQAAKSTEELRTHVWDTRRAGMATIESAAATKAAQRGSINTMQILVCEYSRTTLQCLHPCLLLLTQSADIHPVPVTVAILLPVGLA